MLQLSSPKVEKSVWLVQPYTDQAWAVRFLWFEVLNLNNMEVRVSKSCNRCRNLQLIWRKWVHDFIIVLHNLHGVIFYLETYLLELFAAQPLNKSHTLLNNLLRIDSVDEDGNLMLYASKIRLPVDERA